MTPERLADLSARAYRHMKPWTAAQFAETLSGAHSVLAATEHAFVLGQVIADEAEILALAADPDVQRRGEGSKALELFHETVRERGANQVFLEVAALNSPARAFYIAQGYGEIGQRKAYYRNADGSRDDAVIMQRALPSRHRPEQTGATKTG